MIAVVTELGGERIGALLAEPPEDAPADVREGYARRNIVATGGTCPCGARMTLPPRAERRRLARRGEVIRVNVVHADTCAAVDSNLRAALARWVR